MADKWYLSPRWSAEILDCSMPMTFDTYNLCSYQCQYCFAFYQQSHYEDYINKNMRNVNVEKVKKIFTDLDNPKNQFAEYVKKRIPMQWGGMAEPFDLSEKKKGITLELLKFFREIDYPISFSSKSVWHLKDEEYLKVLRGAKNLHVKVSIITLDEEKARRMEVGVPTPKERLWAIKQYADMGITVNLRLRPFMIGVSNPTHLDLIREAKKAGAYGVSTEFFCLEARADHDLKKRYKLISDICGFDVWEFYRKFSKQMGYRRLNYEIKRPYIVEMENLCKELGLKFFVSDANHKERSECGSCCGLPKDNPYFSNFAKCQFTEAIVYAKKHGEVKFSDITKNEHKYLETVMWGKAQGYNTANVSRRGKNEYKTMFDFMRTNWNKPNCANSPYKYFDGILIPDRLDENGDVVYKFNQKKYDSASNRR